VASNFLNYRQWKSLAAWNGKQYTQGLLEVGTKIKYKGTSFQWRPKGSPYMIQNGDYLSKIAKKVYDDQSKWKVIWDNNKQMIRFPDLIFAGFTLYYVPKEELANQGF
jgi:nucleoid-associated protein YgaU